MAGRRRRWLVVFIAAVLGFATDPGAALDFHAEFETRCGGCHGHAGPFVRERLVLDGDMLRSRRDGRAIGPFLAGHGGGLDPDTLQLFLGVFASQLRSEGLYERRCRICHDRATNLVRLRLIKRDGALIGRYTGRDIETFLRRHGTRRRDEADTIVSTLRRIAEGR